MNLLRATLQSNFTFGFLAITWSVSVLFLVARPELALTAVSWVASILSWSILSRYLFPKKPLQLPAPALSQAQGDWIHTLSQPIHSALFAASALQRPDFAPEKRDRYVQQIQASLQEAADLIKKPGGTPP